MRMLLVQLPHIDRVPSLVPLGIANIANSLTQVGVEFDIFDIFAHLYSKNQISEYLRNGKWDLIGISALSTQYEWARWFAAEAKLTHPDAIVIMGGTLPTYNAQVVLEKTATDICVISEGEETIKDLVKNLGRLDSVKGIWYKTEDGQIKATLPRPYISNLDSIPNTRYDIFPMDIYFKILGASRLKTINMVTSRGCPYSCNYCSRTFSSARFRSISNVVEEIGLLQDKYNIQAVAFNDELVLANKKRGYELCEKIKPLKVYWECQGRANLVDLDLLKAMKDAGCMSVGYGIESGSQKILDNMNKCVTVQQNELAIINTIKANMIPIVQMIYGYPGEDMNTIRETAKFFERVKFYPPTAIGKADFSLLIPLPGSPIYDELIKNNKIKDEENYLLGLGKGYNVDSPLLMNLTQMSDKELLIQKDWLTKYVKINYQKHLRIHPHKYFWKYYRLISSILCIEGYKGLWREFIWRVKNIKQRYFIKGK